MENTKKEKSVFEGFTNLYELSKTLRFELKPVGEIVDYVDPKTKEIKKITQTEKMLLENQVFEKDKTIDDSYNQAKFYFDTLHQKFINSALSCENANDLHFGELAKFLENKNKEIIILRKDLSVARQEKNNTQPIQEKINKIEKEINGKKEEFYKNIRVLLDEKADEWKREYQGKELENGEKIQFNKKDGEEKKNQKGVSFLVSAGALQVLKYEFPESKEKEFKESGFPSLFVEERENPGEKRYIFNSFNRFSGYLTKFQETRKNIYADNGISTALATRIISNFEIFLANKKVYENKYVKNAKKIGLDFLDIFSIDNYKKYLLQNNIEALDGYEDDTNSYNKIIGQFNKNIKEYRDKMASEAKGQKQTDFKKSDYPLFKKLEKQILGKVEKEKQLIEENETETEEDVFIQRFGEFINMNESRFSYAKNFMDKLFEEEFMSEYEGVFIKNLSVNTISRRWFSQGQGIEFERNLPQVSSKKENDVVKIKKFVTLADIKSSIEKLEGNPYKEEYYKNNIIKENDVNLWLQFLSIWKFEFQNLFKDIEKENGEITQGYDACLLEAKRLKKFSKERKPEEVALIKNYADASLCVFQMMKYIAIDERDMDKIAGISTDFYAELDEYAKDFKFNKYYNAFRNYITKKPFDTDKIKLNFEKSTLLKGFSKQYDSYIFKKTVDGLDEFYLGILKQGEIDETDYDPGAISDFSYFPASQLKFQNLVNKAFSSRFGYIYSKQGDEIRAVKDAQLFIKERHLKKYNELKDLVDGKFGSKKEFTKAVNKVCIEIYAKNSFLPLSKKQVEDKHDAGDLYLFKIYNRDWSKNKKIRSQKKIHSLYFENLFCNKNLEKPVLKISGGSEVFFRDKSEKIKQEHIFTKKNNKDITKFLKEKFDVERCANNRYTEKHYFLHLSAVVNYGKPKPPTGDKLSAFIGGYNKETRKKISKYAKLGNINVIGLDRGEKHLVYYSVINQAGEIINQGSLNEIESEINGKKVKINYYEKLVAREKERLESRQSWNQVGKIKDLKKGYISQVVRKIADLAIEHNAIIVMEDLNMRFKQIRGGIERSVYQQLEKQLIDKFGYLVFKDRDIQEFGGVLNGYQLSAPFDTFEKMGKQTGIIFYTQADYTSVTDPLTGFRKNIYISNSASQKTIVEAIDNFQAIGWDEKEQSYFLTYNPIKFVDDKYKKNTLDKEYTVYAKAPRIRREKDEKGYWQYQPIDVNKKFKELFEIWDINSLDGNIKKQIQLMEQKGLLKGEKIFDGKSRSFYHSFVYLFNIILQLRNSYSEQWVTGEVNGEMIVKRVGENVDFIASPVKPFFSTQSVNAKGIELSQSNFDSFEKKIIGKEKERIIKEFNGDANGAYNIARKGIMLLKAIQEKPENPDLYISKFEWDKFSQTVNTGKNSKWNPTSKFQK